MRGRAADPGTLGEATPPSRQQRAQRVVVRMLFDPAFAARVHADPLGVLAEEDLGAGLSNQLAAHDVRLWGADRLRRQRALKVLLEEIRAAPAEWFLARRGSASLLAFFPSPEFHRCVQARGYVVLAFVAWLERVAVPEVPAVRPLLAVEGALALARRELRELGSGRDPRPSDRPGARGFRARPGVVGLCVPEGTLERLQELQRFLFGLDLVPLLAWAGEGGQVPEPPRPGPGDGLGLAVSPGGDGSVAVSTVAPEFGGLLAELSRTRSLEELLGLFPSRSPRQLAGMLADLEAAGLVERR
jgi:hypothetical protein